ncbi:hypothetical protein BDR07DRAFT_1459051, partial [Suillus spraguei]
MTIVSNNPIWWPSINSYRISSYLIVAAFVGLLYDWLQSFLALTFGREVDLVWRQPWSLMTILYLSVRYLGIFYAALDMRRSFPTNSLTDTVGWILYVVCIWIYIVVVLLLWVITITRLYAMYQRSRKMLIFLVVPSVVVNIFNGVATIAATMHGSGEELILSGTYQCTINYAEDILLLSSINWILGTVWEVLVLCLAVWIAVKHFRELRQHSAGGIIEDCFTVLIKTHVLYFASFVAAVSCFEYNIKFSPTSSTNIYNMDTQTSYGLLQIWVVVQLFVLGPRLILSIREYHAKLVADSDAAAGMTSIALQERVYISTA